MRYLAILLVLCVLSPAEAAERPFQRFWRKLSQKPQRAPQRLSGPRATALTWATHLNRTGRFHHAGGVTEVIYRSSGRATRAEAMRAWRKSPPHRKLLPRIKVVRCVGRVCVGR